MRERKSVKINVVHCNKHETRKVEQVDYCQQRTSLVTLKIIASSKYRLPSYSNHDYVQFKCDARQG